MQTRPRSQEIARAYDAIAEVYDQQVQGDQWMRRLLWRHYRRVFRAGHRVLDVGCGTGIDALFLARHGIRVTGIDISPGMVAQLRAKAEREGLTHAVEACVLDLAALASWPPNTFDGLISAFASLNTVPDLSPFAAAAARLLRPGGRMVLHMLNRSSLWERLGLLMRGQWGTAWQLGRRSERTFPIGGRPVLHHLGSPMETYRRWFAPDFRLRQAYALGVLRPPHTVRRVPPVVVEALGWLECRLGAHAPFLNEGRFFVLDLERR